MAVGKLHILWPHLDSDLFTKITIFLVRFFVLTVGYYEASEGQPVLGLTVLGPLLDEGSTSWTAQETLLKVRSHLVCRS